jgi:hypothetical protein
MNIRERVRELLEQKGPGTHVALTHAELMEIGMALGAVDPDPLRMARADKTKDVRHLKAEDILLEVVRMVREVPEDRDTRMVIVWHTYAKAEPDGSVRPYRRAAGMTNSRMIATLFAEAVDISNAWNGPS